MDNVLCEGSEEDLAHCRTADGWGSSDCTQSESAGVVCLDPDLDRPQALDAGADQGLGVALAQRQKPKTRIKVSGGARGVRGGGLGRKEN